MWAHDVAQWAPGYLGWGYVSSGYVGSGYVARLCGLSLCNLMWGDNMGSDYVSR